MAQSIGMVRVASACMVVATAIVLLAPPPARASDDDADARAAADGDNPIQRWRQTATRLRAEQRLHGDDDDAGADPTIGMPGGMGALFFGRSGLLGTVLLAGAFYFLFMRGRSGASSSWGSYYLFWIVGPALIAAVSAHPAWLIVIVIGLVLRRWLPDPLLFLKHQGRVRSLQADIDANASNATARRDLAKIWLEKHRPRRALPLLEQALARDPDSIELLYLSGVSHLLAGNHDKAVDALVTVVHRDPGFQYGEAYLRAADALIALGRWDDADDALERYVKINGSSLEGRCKRVRVCRARNDASGAARAREDLRAVWRGLPSYQRRRQVGWYLRSLI
jgi:hypothetical protein